jgi:tRNA pseudouridine38-40 synthase
VKFVQPVENKRYFIKLSYHGKSYHGWQFQPNSITVQEVLQDAVRTLLRGQMEVIGCGRTDTGVHASKYFAHFDAIANEQDIFQLKRKINWILPRDISVQEVFEVPTGAHSRFSAISRTYHYFIQRRKSPFTNEFSWWYEFPLNLENMQKAASILFDYEDFTSFSKLHTDVKTNNCKIMQAEVIELDGQMIFTFQADRFLRNMVRAMVGTLVDVGRGKITLDGFRQIIESKNRMNAGTSVPPQGLFLVDVAYPCDIVPAAFA